MRYKNLKGLSELESPAIASLNFVTLIMLTARDPYHKAIIKQKQIIIVAIDRDRSRILEGGANMDIVWSDNWLTHTQHALGSGGMPPHEEICKIFPHRKILQIWLTEIEVLNEIMHDVTWFIIPYRLSI